jgi:hypothetical protein
MRWNARAGREDVEARRRSRVERLYGATCPWCSTRLSSRSVRFGRSFRCPSCDSALAVPNYYPFLLFFLSLFVAGGTAAALPVSGWLWVLTSALLFFPSLMLVSAVTHHIVSPPVRLTNDDEGHEG